MRTYKKTAIILGIIAFLLAVVLAVSIWFIFWTGRVKLGELKDYNLGDSMLNVEVFNGDGKLVKLSSMLNGKPGVVLYLSDTCGTCIDLSSRLELFLKVFESDALAKVIVWTDEIPKSVVEKYNIPMAINTGMRSRERLSASMPTLFIVDAEGNITHRDDQMDKVVAKLCEMDIVPNEVLRANARPILESLFTPDDDKAPLVYFYMTGCPDCAESDAFIKDNPRITDTYTIQKVHKYNEEDRTVFIDHFSVLKNTYGISWFPSFIMLEEEPVVIGQLENLTLLNGYLFPEDAAE